MPRGYARLRERNQLTLPPNVVEKMGLGAGDLVEFSVTPSGTIELRPAKIVTAGSEEALREEEAAKEEISQGRYSVIENAGDFRKHVERIRAGDAPADDSAKLETVHLTREQRQEVEAVTKSTLLKFFSGMADAESIMRDREKKVVERGQVRSKAGGSV